MTLERALATAVSEFETILNRSWAMGGADFKSNRKDVIQLRREISAKIAEIAELASRTQDPEWQIAFRTAFSKMRTTMSLHHASWPIVAIQLNDPHYRTSAQETREANERFIRWMRCTVINAKTNR